MRILKPAISESSVKTVFQKNSFYCAYRMAQGMAKDKIGKLNKKGPFVTKGPFRFSIYSSLLPCYIQFRVIGAIIDVEIISGAVIVVIGRETNLKLR